MVRILHSVSNMDRAGIETMLMNYYRHIDRTKIQFDFLCNKTKPGAYDDEIKEMGGRIYHTPVLNPAKYPSYLKCMKKIFVENPEYKIVEAHNGALGVYPPLMEKPVNQKPSLHQMEHYQKFYENGEYVRAVESTTEQNYNMIDGCANNLPKPRIINGRESVLDKLRIRQMAREKQKSGQMQEQSIDIERNRK